jgi:leucyl aminopeptidase
VQDDPSTRDANPAGTLPLHCISDGQYPAWRDGQSEPLRKWLDILGFRPTRGHWTVLPDAAGQANGVLVGTGPDPLDARAVFWLGAALADQLPCGNYRLAQPLSADERAFVLGWAQGGYRFLRYRSAASLPKRPHLAMPESVDAGYVQAATSASAFARDLINTPANDMGPDELQQEAARLTERCGGELRVVRDASLAGQFPLIAAVGQGSARAPRLLDLRFARAGAPRVTLVGKGVCFDTGGLDMKASAGMALMKKDMGGAASALAAAQMLRELEVPIDLRVVIPAVENSVDGNAYRPGDVWKSRRGLSVEITNTDAEGRLVLADALALASEATPDLLVDFATLTGAARVALGPELPPVYGGSPELVRELLAHADAVQDPLWPMPLWDGYEDELSSRIADLNNAPSGGMAGSITAALFLRRFVADPARWLHLDIYGWNARDRPGRPQGAEAQGIRAVVELLRQRFA